MIERDKETDEPLVIDVYGIKVRTRARDLGEEPPKTWHEVRAQVHGHLLRLATAPTRLLVEILEGATKLVKGIGALPQALNKRIEASHDVANEVDSRRISSHLSADEAMDQLERVLTRLRVKGYCAKIVLGKDGTPIVMVVAPEQEPAAISAAEVTLADTSASPSGSPTATT